MAQLTFAAVDLGAESGRVVAGHYNGKHLELEVMHRFANTPVLADGTFYWDVLRLWHEIQSGLGSLGQTVGQVAGIGVDTWGVDFGLLDATDKLIGNPVHYRDQRNAGMMELAQKLVPGEEIYSLTGIQFMPFNSLFQLLAIKNRAPEQLQAAHNLLFMPDLLHFWLSGQKSNEYSISSTSQMLNAVSRTWDTELLAQMGLPAHLLAPPVLPGTRIGELRPEVAAACNLPSSTPIIAPACHDTGSAVAAVPWETGVRAAYLSSGTWSLMGLELKEPLITEESFRLGFTNEGGADGTIRFLKNIAGLWLVQECRRTWLRQGHEYSYVELTRLAAEIPAGGPIVEPDASVFAAPGDMPLAIREYCQKTGQPAPQSVGQVVRCCLDSLALKYRWTLEKLESLSGVPLEALYVVGGGTQNKLLSQLTADCINRPVICGPVEATAAGNVLLQAMGSGELANLAEIRNVVRSSFESETFVPTPQNRGSWEDTYLRFLDLQR